MNPRISTIPLLTVLISSFAIMPFLMPFAYFPINKFFSEFYSLIVALLIFMIFAIQTKSFKLSSATIACFAFAIFMAIQPIFTNITLLSINLYLCLQFLILGLFSLAITSLANYENSDSTGMRRFMLDGLCWGLLISGVLQSLIGYVQFAGHEADFGGWVLASNYNDGTGSNIFGNIGQRNQYINLLSTAAIATIYLFFHKRIKLFTCILCLCIYNAAMTFCAGRTVFVYFAFALMVCGLMILKNRKKTQCHDYKKIFQLIAGYVALLIVTELALPFILGLFSTQADIPTGIKRLSSEYVGQSTYRRFYEWYKALIIFAQHPLVGIGWFQYPKEAIYMMLDKTFYYIPANKRLYTHCHNSILNIMAETGIIGTFITIIYGVIYSIYKLLKNCEDGLFIVMLCSPILMHSCFEYPLWYTYFLVLLVLLLSFTKPVFTVKKITATHRTIITLIVVGIFAIAGQTFSQAFTLLKLSNIPEDTDAKTSNIQALEDIVDQKYNIFAYSALLTLDGYLPQNIYDKTSTQGDIKYIDLLGNVAPFPSEIFKQMLIYHAIGKEDRARYFANLLTHAYPALQQDFIVQMNSCTDCGDLISIISGFAYEDRSPFAKWFDAVHHKQSY